MTDKKSILVVCRTAAGQMYLGVLLNRMWYAPVLAKTVEEAVRLSQATLFSIIIVDGDVPEAELRSVLSRLTVTPTLDKVPLIVFVTRENPMTQQQLLSLGCSAVLTKPLDLSIVYGVLQRLSGQPRNTPRAPVKMKVLIDEGVPEPSLMATNISEGGVYLRTASPLPEKTVLHIAFTLPRSSQSIEATAEVVRVIGLGTQLENEPGMGLRFSEIDEDSINQIRNFVQWELAGDLEWVPNF